jgi:hypothetical protein
LADLERERLFAIIEELVKWENTTNAVAPCRWRRSGWGWRAMPAISIRWRC